MRQMRALVRASVRELLRDRMVTGLAMAFPMMFIVMFLFLPDLPQPRGRISALDFGLPAVLIFAVLSLALTGTAAPMAQLRRDGVLRSLGMTPVTRGQYLWAQLPGRLVVIGVETGLICALAALTGSSHGSPLLLAWAVVLCTASALSMGLLIGARTDNPALVGALSGLLAPGLLFLCGVFLPYRMMPSAVERIGLALPYTYVGDMLRAALAGTALEYPLARGSLVCIAWTVVMGLLAGRIFVWDTAR
ncbi:ABC transporter permease [Propionibacterium australiense]|uniref:Transport permease protein n=1 Tax=Propionibacterium australiense TaxID=119981 RepID=A0A383S3Z3_9ACTN|nr:ABC transporter permease [Propionibacterium australiense]RLP11137.1 ABC transporter permease [Propionibacterium australiense]RLP12464.1 ABC transporter permease [Propionibacterium australiense]SYZ32720.1 ABC transporter integral membrane type-2 domain profile [Propionibacterium australiense]VEH91478.1 ABC-type transport system involved in multi-copper enzyme maturation, permease component [Propionibacterium australiense]